MLKSILHDGYCEGYKVRRKTPLSPVKYFNQKLLNYSQKFASDTDYIFSAKLEFEGVNKHCHVESLWCFVKCRSIK